MNLYPRIGMFLFIVGSVLAIVDGAFLESEAARGIVYLILIFCGVFAGLLNVTEDEEHHFLVSVAAFIIVVTAFNQLFAGEPVLGALSRFFKDSVAFIGSMGLIVALRTVLEFGSDDSLVTPRESMETRTAELADWQLSRGMRAWHFVVFLATALTFLILLTSLPFYSFPPALDTAIIVVEWAIIIIFLVDLYVLYRAEGSWERFRRNCWVDMLAATPMPGVFGVFKVVRVARIARLARLARGAHTVKFFSGKSGMNTYLRKAGRHTEPVVVQEHPVAQKRSAKKA